MYSLYALKNINQLVFAIDASVKNNQDRTDLEISKPIRGNPKQEDNTVVEGEKSTIRDWLGASSLNQRILNIIVIF